MHNQDKQGQGPRLTTRLSSYLEVGYVRIKYSQGWGSWGVLGNGDMVNFLKKCFCKSCLKINVNLHQSKKDLEIGGIYDTMGKALRTLECVSHFL